MPPLVTSTIGFSKHLISSVLGPGDIAVDATAGNGNDTVFLAKLVGDAGRVHSFDIQPEALKKAGERVRQDGVDKQVVFHATGHENMLSVLPEEHAGMVRAVVYNLGFLPGSDESIVTKSETTLKALNASCQALAPDGVISIICYTGHPGGQNEAATVSDWCKALDFAEWRVLRYEVANKPGDPIILYFIEKKG